MQILTEWRRTIHPIRPNEEVLRDASRVKHCAPLLHHLLLLRDQIHPFPLVNIRARPQRYLVKFSSKVNHCDRETTLGVPWWRLGGKVLQELSLFVRRFSSILVWGGDEEQF